MERGNGSARQRDTGGTRDHGAWRRDGDIAPYRNGARAWSTVTGTVTGAVTGSARARARRGVCNGRRVAMRFIKKGQESVSVFGFLADLGMF